MIADEMAQAPTGGQAGSLSKKEKRLMKQQLQKDKAKKKQADSDDEESEEEDAAIEEVEEKAVEDEEVKEEEEMEDDGAPDSDDPVKDIKAFKKLVIKTLEDNEMQEKRACKMEIMDFLNLLNIFNQQGIHFKWLLIN